MLGGAGVFQRVGRPRANSGVAAIEFGLVAPVMTIILLGTVDLAQALVTMRRVTVVAWETGEIATQMSVQQNQTTILTPPQLYQASTLIYAVFPALRGGTVTNPALSTYSVTVSDVVFAPVASGCTGGFDCSAYSANVAWSVPLDKGQQFTRACGLQNQVTPTAPADMTNVPTKSMTALKSALIVDVTYKFTPFFGAFISGPITIRRTAMINQRSIVQSYIYYDTPANHFVCQGYV